MRSESSSLPLRDLGLGIFATLTLLAPAVRADCVDYTQGLRWVAGWNMQHYEPGFGLSSVTTIARGGTGVFVSDEHGGISSYQETAPGSLTYRGGLSTWAAGLKATSNRVYAVNGSGLTIINSGNLANLTTIGSVAVPVNGGLDVAGQYAYVASDIRMTVVKLTEPTPVVMGQLAGQALDLVVRGNRVYVLTPTQIKVVNVTNPSSPTLVATINLGVSNQQIAVDGAYLYVADFNAGLRVLSLSNPDAPAQVALVAATQCTKVSAGNGAALIATNVGMTYVDIQNPASPVKKGHDASLTMLRAAMSGQFAYLASANNGLDVMNLGNGTNVTPVQTSSVLAGAAHLARMGHYVLAAQNPNLTVTDVQDPLNPVQIGQVAAWGDFALQGSYAYVATGGGLAVVDLAVPSSPTIVTTLDSVPSGMVSLDGTRLYIVPQDSYEVWTVDISNPTAPSLLGFGGIFSPAFVSCAANGSLYTADSFEFSSQLSRWDMSDPNNPQLVALNAFDDIGSLRVVGNRLLVGCRARLWSIDAATLDNLSGASSVGDHVFARRLALGASDRVLGWTQEGGFSFFNGTVEPHYLASSSVNSGGITDLIELDDYIYVARTGALEIFAMPCMAADAPLVAAPSIRTPLRVFPNPFSGETTIELAPSVRQASEVIVCDASGRLVRRIGAEFITGSRGVRWDGRDEAGRLLPSGVYFARVAGISSAPTVRLQIVR